VKGLTPQQTIEPPGVSNSTRTSKWPEATLVNISASAQIAPLTLVLAAPVERQKNQR